YLELQRFEIEARYELPLSRSFRIEDDLPCGPNSFALLNVEHACTTRLCIGADGPVLGEVWLHCLLECVRGPRAAHELRSRSIIEQGKSAHDSETLVSQKNGDRRFVERGHLFFFCAGRRLSRAHRFPFVEQARVHLTHDGAKENLRFFHFW